MRGQAFLGAGQPLEPFDGYRLAVGHVRSNMLADCFCTFEYKRLARYLCSLEYKPRDGQLRVITLF